MYNSAWFKYNSIEFLKIRKYQPLQIIWSIVAIFPPIFTFLIFRNPANLATSNSVDITRLLESKMSFVYDFIQIFIIPICAISFFVTSQLEFKNNTYLWTAYKKVSPFKWLTTKFFLAYIFTLLFIYISFIISSIVLYCINSGPLVNVDKVLVQSWFWKQSVHFLFLPIPICITMFLVGLVVHRYSFAMAICLLLVFLSQQQYTIAYPFSSLRISLNLARLILKGSPLWDYTDFYKYYKIVICYSFFLFIALFFITKNNIIYKTFK